MTALTQGTRVYRVYDGTWGYDEPNPGFGDARFSPFDASSDGHRVSTLYAAETETGALLETVFHEVHQDGGRIVYDSSLREQLLAHVKIPAPLRLVDLRDAFLARASIDRSQLVSSPAEHYPCTRRIARHIYDTYAESGHAHGLLWHTRQAELTGDPPTTVMIVFADMYPAHRGGWQRIGPGSQNLLEGPGRLKVDAIANDLGATIVTG